MDFSLDETQRSVASLAADVLARSGSGDPGPDGYDAAAWKALGEAGLLSLALPERLGGDGLGVLETMLVLTEVGRRAATLPALATLALGVLPIVRHGTPAQQDALFADVGRIFTAGVREPATPLPPHPATVATGDGDQSTVTGVKVGVPYAAAAHRILVPASLGAAVVGHGGDLGASRATTVLLLVDPAGPGVVLEDSPSSGDAPEYTLRLDTAPAERLGGADAVEDLYRLALAGACAAGDGLLAGMLALTGEHVAKREQFGRPLAAFQAVSQQVADVYLAAQAQHLTTLSACWRLSAGLPPDRDLDVAAYWLAEYGPAVAQTCHHLHGGLGVDITYPMHRYYAQLKDLARFVGGASHRLDQLGTTASEGAACF